MLAHGHLELIWVENTLYVKVFGPFNVEGAAEAARSYIAEIKGKNGEPFSVIEFLDDDSLGSPEVMKNVSNIWHLLGKSNCTSLALVYANSVQRTLAEQFMPGFGKPFRTLAEAEQWILSRGG